MHTKVKEAETVADMIGKSWGDLRPRSTSRRGPMGTGC